MNLLDKLPHKPPALLLDAVLEVSEDSATCSLARKPDASLLRDGGLPSPLALEAMAQTAAVWLLRDDSADFSGGMLIHCRDFSMTTRTLDVAAGLRARAKPDSAGSVTGLRLFTGEILDAADNVLARAEFSILTAGRPQ